jgi:hypothetical protein
MKKTRGQKSRDTVPLRLVDVVTVHMGVVLASRQLFKLQIKALFKESTCTLNFYVKLS